MPSQATHSLSARSSARTACKASSEQAHSRGDRSEKDVQAAEQSYQSLMKARRDLLVSYMGSDAAEAAAG